MFAGSKTILKCFSVTNFKMKVLQKSKLGLSVFLQLAQFCLENFYYSMQNRCFINSDLYDVHYEQCFEVNN